MYFFYGPWKLYSRSNTNKKRKQTTLVSRVSCQRKHKIKVIRAHKGCLGRKSRSEEHTSELQSRQYLVCRLLLEKKIHSNFHKAPAILLCHTRRTLSPLYR